MRTTWGQGGGEEKKQADNQQEEGQHRGRAQRQSFPGCGGATCAGDPCAQRTAGRAAQHRAGPAAAAPYSRSRPRPATPRHSPAAARATRCRGRGSGTCPGGRAVQVWEDQCEENCSFLLWWGWAGWRLSMKYRCSGVRLAGTGAMPLLPAPSWGEARPGPSVARRQGWLKPASLPRARPVLSAGLRAAPCLCPGARSGSPNT